MFVFFFFSVAHFMFNPDTMACGAGNGCKGTYFSWHCDCKKPGTVLDKSNTSQCLDSTYNFVNIATLSIT